MWWVAAAGVLVVVTGLPPLPEAFALLTRVTPVLVFLAAITVFAGLVAWLANTASLLLPVSNLTNLLAVARMHKLGESDVLVMVLPARRCWAGRWSCGPVSCSAPGCCRGGWCC